MVDHTVHEDLAQVVAHGGPAQRAEAERLLAALVDQPGDAVAVEAARLLLDAYLHDPYLERG
ncbi:MAG: hypothetical protein RL134_178 [Actinomycetota bacterium]|jgi:hypothetical protein